MSRKRSFSAAFVQLHGDALVIRGPAPGEPNFEMKTIHISCNSDWYRGSNHKYGGIIIYGYDGKSDWYTANRTHCKTGYLVIQDTDCKPTPQDKFPNEPGIVHGAIYRNSFGESCTKHKVVGEGFSVVNGKFQINSITLNAAEDEYHDEKKTMNRNVVEYVGKVVEYWKEAGYQFTRRQNHNIKDLEEIRKLEESRELEVFIKEIYSYATS